MKPDETFGGLGKNFRIAVDAKTGRSHPVYKNRHLSVPVFEISRCAISLHAARGCAPGTAVLVRVPVARSAAERTVTARAVAAELAIAHLDAAQVRVRRLRQLDHPHNRYHQCENDEQKRSLHGAPPLDVIVGFVWRPRGCRHSLLP